MNLNEWAYDIAKWREQKKFYTPMSLELREEREAMLGKLMLVTSELGEASEAVRKNDISNFKEEIADAIIRLLDIAGSMQMDIETVVQAKMKVNEGRPERHGTSIRL